MTVMRVLVALVFAGCAAQARQEESVAEYRVPGVTPAQARAGTIEVLQEFGLDVRSDPRGVEVVGSTGDGILRGEAQRFVMCPRARWDRAAFLVLEGSGGYGTMGSFTVRIEPVEAGVGLTIDADFEAPECPSVPFKQRSGGQPLPMCTKITCESTGVLEQRVVKRIAGSGAD